jgi:HEAT repeat protein
VISFWLNELTDRSYDRVNAAEKLGDIGWYVKDPRIVTALIEALEDRDWNVRKMAASSLGCIKDPAAVEALVRLLEDP